MRKITRIFAPAAIALALAVTALNLPTNAYAEADEAQQIAAVVGRATATTDSIEAPVNATGGRLRANAGPTGVDIPHDPAQPVTVTATDGRRVGIGLPASVRAGRARQTGTGTVVYPDTRAGSDVVVQALDDGSVRAMVVIADRAAALDYRFPMDLPAGTRLEPAADGAGGIEVTDGEHVYATVAPAWAVDAKGTPVPTSYRIEGDTLIQRVQHRAGLTYPVVADPSVSLGWFIYVRWSKSEIKMFPDWVLQAGSGTLAAYMCPKIPNAVAKAACGAVAAVYVGSVVGTIKDAKKANQCVEMRYNYAPQLLVGWRRYNC